MAIRLAGSRQSEVAVIGKLVVHGVRSGNDSKTHSGEERVDFDGDAFLPRSLTGLGSRHEHSRSVHCDMVISGE